MQIPCHVIAGPLGVGKTTTILDFLKSRMGVENTAVLVNDFGQTGLDAEILNAAGSGVEVRNIPGGCLCCSSIHDLRAGLEAALERRGELTRIIIEPSGLVIMPDFLPYLIRLCEAFDLELRPVIVLLNPKRTKEAHYRALPFFSTLVNNADVLVANRIDQCSEPELVHFREWTAALRPPKLRVVETSFGRLPESLFKLSRGEGASGLIFHTPHMHEESSGGFSAAIEPVSEAAMQERIKNWIQNGIAGAELIRFKAILPTDNGWRLFEIADGSDYVRPMPMAVNCKLDWISRGEVSEAAIRAELASCRLL